MPARLRPTAPTAADAILVGDPGRALMLAQELLREPKMSNHARGLWGYSGPTPAGGELTVQSTGMGGPSASVVLRDLAELGVRRAIRIGTGVGLGDLELGEPMVVGEARTARGAAAHPSAGLSQALRGELEEAATGMAISLDSLHDPGRASSSVPADVADMQTAALFAAAAELGVELAALLIVSERSGSGQLRDEELAKAAIRAGRAAAAVLSP
jgi:uridine phosphorylase